MLLAMIHQSLTSLCLTVALMRRGLQGCAERIACCAWGPQHLGEEVMRDVRVRNVVVHHVQEWPEAAVDCAQSAAQPVPLLVIVVRQRLVRVL